MIQKNKQEEVLESLAGIFDYIEQANQYADRVECHMEKEESAEFLFNLGKLTLLVEHLNKMRVSFIQEHAEEE